MKKQDLGTRRKGDVRISVKPGKSVIQLLSAAVEKRIRAGAGRMSIKHFLWPDFAMMPELVHPSGKGFASAIARRRAARR